MTLNVLLVVTFSLLPFPWNDLDDLWTKSVESLGWYNPLWRWHSFIQARTGDLLPHMSRCDLEFHWTRLPSEEPVRAGWVLRAGEVGWLMRHRAQWLLTLRLTPRCSSGRKGVCMYVCVYIYTHTYICIYVYMYTCICIYVYLGECRLLSTCGHRFLIAGASYCGAQAPEHRLTVVSQGLSFSQHVGSSRTRFISNTDILCQNQRVRDPRGMFAIGV